MAHWEAAEEAEGWELGLSSSGDGNGGIGLRGDWGICHKEVEYGHTVYCDATNSGPL